MNPDPDAIADIRRRMNAGEPLCEIEEYLDWRENRPPRRAAKTQRRKQQGWARRGVN